MIFSSHLDDKMIVRANLDNRASWAVRWEINHELILEKQFFFKRVKKLYVNILEKNSFCYTAQSAKLAIEEGRKRKKIVAIEKKSYRGD